MQEASIPLVAMHARPQQTNAGTNTLGPYQRYVKAQCRRSPCLQNLSDFLADSNSRRKPGRIACLEFPSADGEPRHRDLNTEGLAMILQNPYTKVGDLSGRILIVEDLAKDVIEMIGSSLEVDPLFFASHLHTSRADVTAKKPFAPPRVSGHDFVHARYVRSFDFGKTAAPGKLLLDASVRRKVVVLPTSATCVGWIQGCVSTLVRLTEGDMWLCLFLVDPRITNKFFSDEKVENQTVGSITLQPHLFQGGFKDFLNSPSYSKEDVSRTPGPDRLSMLDDMIYYWMTERPSVFNHASPSLLSMSYYPLKISAAEWKNFVNVMRYSVEDYESSVEALQLSLTDIGKLETYLRHQQSWRRRSRDAAFKVSSLASFVKPHNANSSYSEVWASVAQDYENIYGSIDSFGRRLEAMGPVVTSLVQIVDSRRSLVETANLSRLTYLALVFVPLTYVSSLFSMSGKIAPGGRAFWVYFAVAIPLLGLVFSIALPPQIGVPLIAGFLRGRTRRWRRPREEVGA